MDLSSQPVLDAEYQVSSWEGQCLSGTVKPEGSGNRDRVVSAPRGDQADIPLLVHPDSGLICDQPEQEAAACLSGLEYWSQIGP